MSERCDECETSGQNCPAHPAPAVPVGVQPEATCPKCGNPVDPDIGCKAPHDAGVGVQPAERAEPARVFDENYRPDDDPERETRWAAIDAYWRNPQANSIGYRGNAIMAAVRAAEPFLMAALREDLAAKVEALPVLASRHQGEATIRAQAAALIRGDKP